MFPKGFEWIVILIVALLIFGPKNLPKLGKSLGSTVKNIREGMDEPTKASEKPALVDEADEDAEIRELEAKLAAAKKRREDSEQGPIDVA
ncbi:twin-arginine translocase TatA/TatE family subunit [Collinsella sp. AGMB00827]|uniref:Sec-independent protein translocase protein TatA n=1 Tax=Collinsella ureilytica TaxID=2869515 RepID=A0ABS7MJH2_9ACTN|nr:twin-arginine translocase TatA/TatE family subunit [Collinsella urealyticum]MBY4797432.1 twin-arginine translocase TatA/TatE family subunit [Collinsella urealyticum]